MKRLKKTVALIAAALLCMLPILNQPLHAEAAEPITYYLKYLESEGEWKYQQLTAWDDNDNYGNLDHVYHNIKDGDTIVINGPGQGITLDFNVQLANVTVLYAAAAVINVKGIDEFYIHGDSVCAVNANVTNAYVHDTSICNFNKNVTNLNIIGTDDVNASVNVVGTVGHVKASDENNLYYELYNFAANTLVIEDGGLKTDAAYYSKTPAAAGTTTTSTASQTTTSAAAGGYDAVPKTGDNYLALMLAGAAVICLFGSYRLRRS